MTEVQKTSPKKLPISEWVTRVKKIDGSGLKEEEKKVFDMVKAHKNIPKTPSKFANFCTHNLKVRDEKIVNRLWGFMSVALHENKGPVKETKEAKKLKLEKKLSNGMNKAKQEGKKKVASSKDEVQDAPESGAKSGAQTKVHSEATSTKVGAKKSKFEKQPNKELNKAKQEVKKKAGSSKNGVPDVPEKSLKSGAQTKAPPKATPTKASAKKLKLEKQPNNGLNKAKQEVKKKVSFSKNGVPEVPKSGAKSGVQTKVPLKATPMKVGAKKSKVDPKKKTPQNKDEDEDDDDDDDESSDDMDFDDDDLSDEDIEDSDEDDELDDDSELDLEDDDDDDDDDDEEEEDEEEDD